MHIDAIAVQTKPSFLTCKNCPRTKYTVVREPAFQTQSGEYTSRVAIEEGLEFVDQWVCHFYNITVNNKKLLVWLSEFLS